MPPEINSLVEHITSATLPTGAAEGINDRQNLGYGGPCPPIGRHRYLHKLYALYNVVEELNEPGKATVAAAIQGHIITQTELIATCQK